LQALTALKGRGRATPYTRRRQWRWTISLALLVVVGAAGLAGWYVGLPRYRPALDHGEIYGIDVSDHQGRIDWREVARSDVSFAFVKATEGSTYVDSDFAADVAQARSAGLLTGAYHFFTLCSPGVTQAANFLKIARPGSTALPPAVDLELSGNCSARPSRSEVLSQLSVFVSLVEQATRQPLIFYIGASFEQRYPVRVAQSQLLWTRRTLLPPSGRWVIWQVDGFAHFDGITGRVDLDVMKSDSMPGRAHW
jgi:lysozyme